MDELLAATPVELSHMEEYADYFADLEGGSAIGRSVEPEPFDVNRIGDDAPRIRTSDAISAPVPMPITSGDFRSMNLMGRRPLRALPTMVKRVVQGVGGKIIRKDMAAGGKALAAALIAGARQAGVDIWLSSPIKRWSSRREGHGHRRGEGGKRQPVAASAGVIMRVVASTTTGRSAGSTSRKRLPRTGASAIPTTPVTCSNCASSGCRTRPPGPGMVVPRHPLSDPGGAPIFMLSERSPPGINDRRLDGHRFFNEAVIT